MRIRESFQRELAQMVGATGDQNTFDSVGETLQPTMLMLDAENLRQPGYFTLAGFQGFVPPVAAVEGVVMYTAPAEGARISPQFWIGSTRYLVIDGALPALVAGASTLDQFEFVGPPLRGVFTTGTSVAIGPGITLATFIGNKVSFELGPGRTFVVATNLRSSALTFGAHVVEYIPQELA